MSRDGVDLVVLEALFSLSVDSHTLLQLITLQFDIEFNRRSLVEQTRFWTLFLISLKHIIIFTMLPPRPPRSTPPRPLPTPPEPITSTHTTRRKPVPVERPTNPPSPEPKPKLRPSLSKSRSASALAAPSPPSKPHSYRSSTLSRHPNRTSTQDPLFRSPPGPASDSGRSVDLDMKRLRSKPATPHSHPASSSRPLANTPTPPVVRTTIPPTSRSASRPDRPQPQVPRSPLSPTVQQPRPRNVLRRKSSATVPRQRDSPPTPARAVAIAYQEQERRRTELVSPPEPPELENPIPYYTVYGTSPTHIVPVDDSTEKQDTIGAANLDPTDKSTCPQISPIIPRSPLSLTQNEPQHPPPPGLGSSTTGQVEKVTDTQEAHDTPVTPYYTVFGSSVGRVVAVGGPSDSQWDWPDAGHTTPSSSKGKEAGILRSLTRKVSLSGRWGRRRDDVDAGRTSEIGTRIDSIGKNDIKSATHADKTNSPPPPPTPLSIDLRADTSSEPTLAPSNGGKLWRLVKRLSTGALRGRYAAERPPPVPALPKQFDPRSEERDEVKEKGRLTMRAPFILGRASMSAPRPVVATHSLPSSPHSHPSPHSHRSSRPHPHRPSTTTRSSSPVSSDGFFAPVHSARSSSSSYGDALPPVPRIARHIVPPAELARRVAEQEQEQEARLPHACVPAEDRPVPKRHTMAESLVFESWMPHTPVDELPSLPFPPRPPRRLQAPDDADAAEDVRTGSPLLPSFSTQAAINTFGARRPPPALLRTPLLNDEPPAVIPRSAFEDAVGPPPRRPSRSVYRPGPGGAPRASSGGASSASVGTVRARSSSMGRESVHARAARARSSADGERGAGRGLTEQEKAARWDALLERSARAGGTLHVDAAGTRLLSDTLS